MEDVTLQQAWDMLSADADAVLIDVRTTAEWNFVGRPSLDGAAGEVRFVEWQSFPSGARNADFIREAASGLAPGQPILLLCRSGARSEAAARALEAEGFTKTYNVVAGFEGHLDAAGHRIGGWKHEGLPWRQS